MKRLIINADDYGMTEAVSKGIIQTMKDGVVTSTTAMLCLPGAEARLLRTYALIPGDVGLHLQLTCGAPRAPLESVPSLLTATGAGKGAAFPEKTRDIAAPAPKEILLEWRKQAERIRGLGVRVSHLDSHHHVHRREDIFGAFCTLAKELGVPVRAVTPEMGETLKQLGIPAPRTCIKSFFKSDDGVEALLDLIADKFTEFGKHEVLELMTHPGLQDEALNACSTYTTGRVAELEILTSPELADGLKAMDVELVGWSALQQG